MDNIARALALKALKGGGGSGGEVTKAEFDALKNVVASIQQNIIDIDIRLQALEGAAPQTYSTMTVETANGEEETMLTEDGEYFLPKN